VRRFWRRRGEAELASRLTKRRQAARPDFVAQLAREVRSTGRGRLAPSRLLLAGVLTVMLLIAAASVGGVSAAAVFPQQVAAVFQSVHKQVAVHGSVSLRSDDDDDDGGGVGGDDDDDDDGEDDEYEEDELECLQAVGQAHGNFHQGAFTAREHRRFHEALEDARDECEEIDDDDDDD